MTSSKAEIFSIFLRQTFYIVLFYLHAKFQVNSSYMSEDTNMDRVMYDPLPIAGAIQRRLHGKGLICKQRK